MANHHYVSSNCDLSSGKPCRPFFGRSVSMYPEQLLPKPVPNNPNQGSTDRAGPPVKKPISPTESLKGKVSKLRSLFESSKSPSHGRSKSVPECHHKLKSAKLSFSKCSPIRLFGTEDRIVVYFTSLRGVRRTFEDCYSVRMIFRGFRLWVDERDMSLDSAYRKELLNVLGEKTVSLPQVFIRGKHVGGADIIKQFHETGELAEILERFPKRAPGFVCRLCGDIRFMPCTNCSGSRKVFDEDEGILKRCWCCNENGLIRCSECN